MTLVELLLALAITTVIGLAISAMLFAVSRTTSTQNDMRSFIIKQKTVESRITAAIRSSKTVLAVGTNYLVLWTADTTADDQPNMSEMRRIEWTTNQKTLITYRPVFPTGWTTTNIAAVDSSYDLASDFNSVSNTLKSNTYFQSETWASNVSNAAFAVNLPTVQQARLVSFQTTFESNDLDSTLIGAAALRGP